ncbi:MAG: hypothetical protein Q9179_001115 [Wetmoreana sp. 5 TL-2023]
MQSTNRFQFMEPKHKSGKFKINRPELIKVNIDLRPKAITPSYAPASSPNFGNILANLGQRAQQKDKNIKPFVNGPPKTGKGTYFGGSLFDKAALRWRQTLFTRASGEVVGAAELKVPAPDNLEKIIRSVCVMARGKMQQTAMWVGPRLLLSALQFQEWVTPVPSDAELDVWVNNHVLFSVESEICSQSLSEFSPKVRLVAHSGPDDLGLFRLQDDYPPRREWIDVEWLWDRDQLYQQNPTKGTKVACIGYSSRIDGDDAKAVGNIAAISLQSILPPHLPYARYQAADEVFLPWNSRFRGFQRTSSPAWGQLYFVEGFIRRTLRYA